MTIGMSTGRAYWSVRITPTTAMTVSATLRIFAARHSSVALSESLVATPSGGASWGLEGSALAARVAGGAFAPWVPRGSVTRELYVGACYRRRVLVSDFDFDLPDELIAQH